MRVLFATAELAPVAGIGGLAQAAAGLVRELRSQEVDVEVALPDCAGNDLAGGGAAGARRPSVGAPRGEDQRRTDIGVT